MNKVLAEYPVESDENQELPEASPGRWGLEGENVCHLGLQRPESSLSNFVTQVLDGGAGEVTLGEFDSEVRLF